MAAGLPGMREVFWGEQSDKRKISTGRIRQRMDAANYGSTRTRDR